MPDETKVELGKVQQTLFFPLLARARETESRRPLLRDPKAVEMARLLQSDSATFRTPMRFLVVLRTMILDGWVAARFPGSRLTFDSYPRVALEWEHKMAAKRDIAFWQWSCDDPRTLERFGLRLLESATATRPPARVRAELPARYRYLLPLADPFLGRGLTLSLFEAAPGQPG